VEAGDDAIDRPPTVEVTTRDGTPLVIRPLVPSDREELARGYLELSDESRRRRFFSPPARLSDALLDYLTELDFDRRFALVAHLRDDPDQRGLGVARWVRSRDDPTRAEAAVTVADRWQGRGIGTELLLALVEAATGRGITTFVADVLWDNRILLDTLRQLGARVDPAEPGVARVEFDLPEPGTALDGTALHRMLVASAEAASA
jgi:protein lysine acetyltransferase